MPSLSNDNSTQITVETVAKGSGIEDTKDGIEELTSSVKDSDDTVGKFSTSFQDGMKNVAKVTAVAGAGLTIFAKSSTDYMTDLVKSSKTLATQTGMTTVEASQLTAVMGRLGIDSNTAAVSFRTLSKNIAEARENTESNAIKSQELTNKIEATKIQIADLTKKMKTNGDSSGELKNKIEALNLQLKTLQQGASESTNSLDKLNVSTKNADGSSKSFYDILLEVSDKFHDMPDGAEKTALALDLFGRSGAGMIKVLNKGSEGIQQLGEEADKLGLTLTTDNIDAVDKYIQSQKDLADSTNSIKMQVAELTTPILTGFNQGLNDVITSVIGVDSPLRDTAAGFLAFGGPVLDATSGIAAFAGNIGSAIPVLQGLQAAVATPMVMPAIAVGAAIASLALVIAKTTETINVVSEAGSSIEAAKKSGEETDAAVQKMADEGKISSEALNTYIRNTRTTAEQTKTDLYSGFFGPLERSLDNLFAMITGTQDAFAGTGFGEEVKKSGPSGGKGWARGGYTGQGSVNEVAGVVHKGEYVLPQELVDQSTGLPDVSAFTSPGRTATPISAGNTSQVIHIAQVILSTKEATEAFFDVRDQDAQRTVMGLSPARGANV